MTVEWLGGGVPGRRRVVVLRHGQTTSNARGIWQGQLDTELSDLGVRQAEHAGATLRSLGVSRIVTSDLRRAARTAQIVGRICGVPVTEDARWREIHAGEWQGMSSAEVVASYPEEYAAMMRGEDIRRGRTGESMTDVANRTAEAVGSLVAGMAPSECVIVSTHGAAARSVTAALLGIEPPLAGRLLGVFDNCHWAELREGREGWRLASWNVGALVESLLDGAN